MATANAPALTSKNPVDTRPAAFEIEVMAFTAPGALARAERRGGVAPRRRDLGVLLGAQLLGIDSGSSGASLASVSDRSTTALSGDASSREFVVELAERFPKAAPRR